MIISVWKDFYMDIRNSIDKKYDIKALKINLNIKISQMLCVS